MADEESPKQISLVVKTAKEKKVVKVSESASGQRENSGVSLSSLTLRSFIGYRSFSSILQLKEQVAKEFSAPLEQLCLIFAGKILKDNETISTHNIKDGLTVHLVIRSPASARGDDGRRPDEPSSGTQPSGVPPNPFGAGGLGGSPGPVGAQPGLRYLCGDAAAHAERACKQPPTSCGS
ncbi:hypothetical protein MRX96_059733 [Rhipicephalus microplus]